MHIDLPPEMEARLKQLAVDRERSTEDVALEMLAAQLEYDTWFLAEVEKGRASIALGHFVTHEEIERRYAKFL